MSSHVPTGAALCGVTAAEPAWPNPTRLSEPTAGVARTGNFPAKEGSRGGKQEGAGHIDGGPEGVRADVPHPERCDGTYE